MRLAALLMCQFVSFGDLLIFSTSFHYDGGLMRKKGRKWQDRVFGANKESNMPTIWCCFIWIPCGLLIHTARIQLTAVWCKVINEEYCNRMMTKIHVVALLLWEYSCCIATQTAIGLHCTKLHCTICISVLPIKRKAKGEKQRKENKGDFPLWCFKTLKVSND